MGSATWVSAVAVMAALCTTPVVALRLKTASVEVEQSGADVAATTTTAKPMEEIGQTVMSVTWNMGSQSADDFTDNQILQLFAGHENYEMVALGVQESARGSDYEGRIAQLLWPKNGAPRAFTKSDIANTKGDKKVLGIAATQAGDGKLSNCVAYARAKTCRSGLSISCNSMGRTALFVFKRDPVCGWIKDADGTLDGEFDAVRYEEVFAGWTEAPNKGSVGVAWKMWDRVLCFMSTHQSMKGSPNDRATSMASSVSGLDTAAKTISNAGCGVTFWMGDFNPRLGCYPTANKAIGAEGAGTEWMDMDWDSMAAQFYKEHTSGRKSFRLTGPYKNADEFNLMMGMQDLDADPGFTCKKIDKHGVLKTPVESSTFFDKAKAALAGFDELAISFPPTYKIRKHVPFTKEADCLAGCEAPQGKEYRCPNLWVADEKMCLTRQELKSQVDFKHTFSWTDRIIVKASGSSVYSCSGYGVASTSNGGSDHAPVKLKCEIRDISPDA